MVGQCCYRVCLWQPRREDATVQDELSFVSDGEAALPVLSLSPVWHLRWSLLFHYGIGEHMYVKKRKEKAVSRGCYRMTLKGRKAMLEMGEQV